MNQRKRILIIDDNLRYLDLAKQSLQEKGYSVSVHERPSESPVAMRYLEPDVVLLNVHMHGLSEEKLSYLISANHQAKGIPVILYAFADEEHRRMTAERHRAEGYICGANISQLYDTVDFVLSGSGDHHTQTAGTIIEAF
jgi:DNA-binding response OmpR family regulator